MWAERVIFPLLFLLFLAGEFSSAQPAKEINIGSKKFPESRLLGEIVAQLLEEEGFRVKRQFGLGGTMICFEAVRQGEIDLYPEYTGTGLTAILDRDLMGKNARATFEEVRQAFDRQYDLTWLEPLGFSNRYALVIRDTFRIEKISQLGELKESVRLGFSHEFLNRPDGYQGLSEHYGFPEMNVRGMDHGLVYMAIEQGEIDVTDAYETDGKLVRYDLKMLEDDLDFFPPYEAALVVRNDLMENQPEVRDILNRLSGMISTGEMRALNFKVEVDGEAIPSVARGFLVTEGLVENTGEKVEGRGGSLLVQQTIRHLYLTLIATLLSVLAGIPLGIYIARNEKIAGLILGFANIVQTIPSLAILGFMIPLFGIGFKPAIAALFLYGLLPVVRNTYTGIGSVDRQLIESGLSMGLTGKQLLLMLELPLATGMIMAGIRISMVINIGTATLAAFIGAGGLGDFIITGITLNDHQLIMKGAIPAALLALTVDFILGRIEKMIRPRGLDH